MQNNNSEREMKYNINVYLSPVMQSSCMRQCPQARLIVSGAHHRYIWPVACVLKRDYKYYAPSAEINMHAARRRGKTK